MSGILSKLVAGGLSAGVVLVWWPTLFESDSATSWVLRGLVWTLMTELLLLTLMPVETALLRHPRLSGARARFASLTARPRSIFNRHRKPMLTVTALLALSIPVGLVLSGAGRVKAPQPPVRNVHVTEEVTKVVRQPIKVQRETVVKRVPVEVTRTVPVPVPSAASPASGEAGSGQSQSSERAQRGDTDRRGAESTKTAQQQPRDSQPEPTQPAGAAAPSPTQPAEEPVVESQPEMPSAPTPPAAQPSVPVTGSAG